MNAVAVAAASARRRRVLAELGLISYRLREAPPPARAAIPLADSRVEGEGRAELRVYAPDAVSGPAGGVEAAIWSQVLVWLGYAAHEVRWHRGDGAIELPAPATWATAQGKRALWLALKGRVRNQH